MGNFSIFIYVQVYSALCDEYKKTENSKKIYEKKIFRSSFELSDHCQTQISDHLIILNFIIFFKV